MTDSRLGLLLVDDEPDLLALLLLQFGSLPGFRVESATSGTLALDLLQTFQPDLLITDLLMPGMDGWSLVAAIRERPELKDLRVLAMSASPTDDAVARARTLGVLQVIPKPFNSKEFMALVAAELARAACHREARFI
jgi:CheY-like chemotaxis protein